MTEIEDFKTYKANSTCRKHSGDGLKASGNLLGLLPSLTATEKQHLQQEEVELERGRIFFKLRQTARLTIWQLAHITNIEPELLQKLEAGKPVQEDSLSLLFKVAKTCNLQIYLTATYREQPNLPPNVVRLNTKDYPPV